MKNMLNNDLWMNVSTFYINLSTIWIRIMQIMGEWKSWKCTLKHLQKNSNIFGKHLMLWIFIIEKRNNLMAICFIVQEIMFPFKCKLSTNYVLASSAMAMQT